MNYLKTLLHSLKLSLAKLQYNRLISRLIIKDFDHNNPTVFYGQLHKAKEKYLKLKG